MRTDTLYGRFKKAALKHAGRAAIRHKRENEWVEYSFEDFLGGIDSLAIFLLRQGIVKGDRIAIMLENRPEWPMVFFATVSIGAILVTVNPEIEKNEMGAMLADFAPCRIFFVKDRDFPRPPSVEKVISVESDEFKKAISRAEPARREKTPDGAGAVSPDDVACILYTSGTTGEPKGVMLSHRNFLSNSDSLHKMNLGSHEDRVFAALPLDQNYPLTVTTILPLMIGANVIYPGSLSAENVVKAMEESKPTIFVGVPQVYHAFHNGILQQIEKLPRFMRLLLRFLAEAFYKIKGATGLNPARHLFSAAHNRLGGSLRYCISGGAKLNEKIAIGLAKFGLKILEGYGLSETSPVLTLNPLAKQKPGSSGVAIPDVEIRISKKNKEGFGEVLARGPNVMKGYYKRPDLTAEVIKDGWFRTGDIGRIDRDGYLFLTGRKKDVIVLSWGGNIHPEEVERAYMAKMPLKEMCVFEAPARSGVKENDVLWAACLPEARFLRKHGEKNIREALKEKMEIVSKKITHYKRVMEFVVTLEPLPRTRLGKIKRYLVREQFGRAGAEQKNYGTGVKKLSRKDTKLLLSKEALKIIDFLKTHTKIENVNPGDSLELDLGIDFLGRKDLAAGLEKTLNIKIKEKTVEDATTVRDLIRGIGS